MYCGFIETLITLINTAISNNHVFVKKIMNEFFIQTKLI